MTTFADIFRAAAGPGSTLDYARFVALALYHPEVGYYRKARPRVGRGPGTDFHTSTTVGPVFAELVIAAVQSLLGPADPAGFTFVELGAEPGAALLEGRPHPFRATRAVGPGEPPGLAGPCVVFSNELFDAQPFLRVVFRRGAWRELGVRLAAGSLQEVELPEPTTAARDLIARLPAAATEDYHVDHAPAAAELLARIAAAPWNGLFLALDYGKPWSVLAHDTPAGTARAYRAHRQHNDLLASPGDQDLTCHVCWDDLAAVLRHAGFTEPVLESQEAFFLRRASRAAAAIVQGAPPGPDPRRLQLQQLIHPTLQGQKFQALHARR